MPHAYRSGRTWRIPRDDVRAITGGVCSDPVLSQVREATALLHELRAQIDTSSASGLRVVGTGRVARLPFDRRLAERRRAVARRRAEALLEVDRAVSGLLQLMRRLGG